MTPRPSLPSLTTKRPLSAIFLGNPSNLSTPSNGQLPDLPDPPISPSSSSGLPSPPATNSTSSGSTGDASTNAGSVRRPLSSHTLNMPNGKGSSISASHRRSKGSSEDDGEDNDEDNTAKLSDDRRFLHKLPTSENASALLRVKSLTQRNRMVLDKLASISSGSRLSTPSPTSALRHSRSPAPPSSSSTSSSRLTSASARRKRQDSVATMSGSETERERVSSSTYSSDDQAATPPATFTAPLRSENVRQRRISAPASPGKALACVAADDRPFSVTPSLTARKRATVSENDGNADVTAVALEAVANSRRSPTGTWSSSRRRQPLPREFRDSGSLDANWGEPSTPHRNISPSRYAGRSSPTPRSPAATVNDPPPSSREPRSHRYSTVREMARRHQTRWLSQDLSSVPGDAADDGGRRQTRRGGSSESPLTLGGRSVVGESLRAAGLAKKRDGMDDPFTGEQDLQNARRLRLSGGLGTRPSLADPHREDSRNGSTTHSEPRTPAMTSQSSQRLAKRGSLSVLPSRPATSMAGYGEEPRTLPSLRSHRSAYPMHERERQPPSWNSARPTSQARNTLPQDRTCASPSTVARRTPGTSHNTHSGSASTAEHTRLMLESLGMFESQLARLPSMGTTTTTTIPELFRSAQNIVHSANTLNSLLRNGTSRALEEQIEAEVRDAADAMDMTDVWRNVGGEYRESLRVSDELVRTMTAFLLGVGKVLRESTNGSQLQHSRGSSLDDNMSRRAHSEAPPSATGRSSAEGIRTSNGHSAESRRSWEPSTGELEKRTPSRLEVFARPPSSLKSSWEKEVHQEVEHPNDSPGTATRSSTITRRLFTPGEPRDRQASNFSNATASTSQDTVLGYEPSPTPAGSRPLDRRRTLPPLSLPTPLQTLPSESLLSRHSSATSRTSRRNKLSTTSNATVRANSIFPSLSTLNPTTAVTTTSASASPEKRISPLRGEAAGSVSRGSSANALAGLQQQYERYDRQRTISGSSGREVEAIATTLKSPMSGSETERDTRPTFTPRVRASLDGAGPHLDHHAPQTDKKERRRTVTDIFTRG